MPAMPTTSQALDTYKRSIKNEREDEQPIWVKEVTRCLITGDNPTPGIWMPFVTDVLEELRK